jgi:hypothetical protein
MVWPTSTTSSPARANAKALALPIAPFPMTQISQEVFMKKTRW